MKTALIIRWGAYGDSVHCSHLPRLLKKDGYHVTFEYNHKGRAIFSYNPYIDQHIYFDPGIFLQQNPKNTLDDINRHLDTRKEYFDRVINLTHSLEQVLLPLDNDWAYYTPKYIRNRKYSKICFYDQSCLYGGLVEQKYMGHTGDLFFKRREHDIVKSIMGKVKKQHPFIIIWSMRGTMWQKAMYPWAEPVIREFLSRHKDVFVYLVGDKDVSKYAFEHERVRNICGQFPFRQVALMTRYASLVVTPETGLGIVAGAFGTPKIMLLTAASIKNICGNDKNDFSLQSEAWCSPCHRAIYNMDFCHTRPIKGAEISFGRQTADKLPICVFFNKERVLNRMEEVYALPDMSNWDAPPHKPDIYM